jgi:sigma-B regulation protein RsbU (phosphoserine phosphatase)
MTFAQPELAILTSAFLGAGITGMFFSVYARQRRREFLAKLADISSEREIVTDYINRWVAAVSDGGSRAELLQMLLKTVERSTGATASCVFERQEDDTLLAAASHGLFPPLRAMKNFSTRAELIDHLLKRESYKLGDGLIGGIGNNREGILIERPRADARVYHHDDPALRLLSLIVVPISFQDTLFGVLALANPRGARGKKHFTKHDLQLTVALAEQAALALHNSDLVSLRLKQNRFDFDLSVASSIQTMLLPGAFPKNSQLDISACYHPAQRVGGDLYDVFELSEGQIGVAIADVSGKGVPASLLMAITQSHLRHLARMHNSPAKVLSEMNKILQPEIRQDMFVTILYAVIDPEGHSIVYARAGHELPILAGNGRTEFLMSDGIAIGMAAQTIFDGSMEEKRAAFAKGDRLILYTDGLTEAINSIGEEFSSRRIAQLSQQNMEGGAEELNNRILKAVENFSGRREQEDDVTLLTIRHL